MSQRTKRNIIIGSLCIVLMLMIVGYASFNRLLNIDGTTNITGVWDIRITNIESRIHGLAINKEEPSYTDLTANFKAELNAPGDYIEYEFEVDNLGDFDAILNAATVTLQCSSVGTDYTKTQECKQHIKVLLLDKNGSDLANSDSTLTYSNRDNEHKLMHQTGNTETFKLKIEYKDDTGTDGANLPKDDIIINNFGATLTYNQYTTN